MSQNVSTLILIDELRDVIQNQKHDSLLLKKSIQDYDSGELSVRVIGLLLEIDSHNRKILIIDPVEKNSKISVDISLSGIDQDYNTNYIQVFGEIYFSDVILIYIFVYLFIHNHNQNLDIFCF